MALNNKSSFLIKFFGFFSYIFEQFKQLLNRFKSKSPEKNSSSTSEAPLTPLSEPSRTSAPVAPSSTSTPKPDEKQIQREALQQAIEELEYLKKTHIKDLSIENQNAIDTQLKSAQELATNTNLSTDALKGAIQTTETLTKQISDAIKAKGKEARESLARLVEASESLSSPDPIPNKKERINEWRENLKKYPEFTKQADKMIGHMEEALNMLSENDSPHYNFLNSMLNTVEASLQSKAPSSELRSQYNTLLKRMKSIQEDLTKKTTKNKT